MTSDNVQEPDAYKSKTQRKQEMREILELAQTMLARQPQQFAQFPLPAKLQAALFEAQRIPTFNARKRHKHYVGKLLAKLDPDMLTTLREHLDPNSLATQTRTHLLEHWRAELLDRGDEAITELKVNYPNVDIQPLRQSLRKAQREQREGTTITRQKALYQLLKQWIK